MTQKGPVKKDDGMFDLEQQFILRMPPGPSMALRHDVESGAVTLKDKLYIEIQNDMRHGCVRYGDKVFKTKLVDTPSIIETLKTTDQKTYYKTADISQMLVCVDDDESSDDENDVNKKPKDKEKKYHWNHGITPPLKNVRKRRFRKTLKKKHPDQPEIEKEVKRLLRMDNEAIDVKWEVVVDEEKPAESGITEQVLAHGETSKVAGMSSGMPLEYLLFGDLSSSLDCNDSSDSECRVEKMAFYAHFFRIEHDIFGDVSSSEDEEDKDVNIMDSGEDDSTLKEADDSLMAIRDDSVLGAELNAEAGELQNRLQELESQLNTLRDQHLELGMQVDMTDDPNLRDKLEAVMKEESEKENEFKILESMLNQN